MMISGEHQYKANLAFKRLLGAKWHKCLDSK
jgi:hypothetical protein